VYNVAMTFILNNNNNNIVIVSYRIFAKVIVEIKASQLFCDVV